MTFDMQDMDTIRFESRSKIEKVNIYSKRMAGRTWTG